MISRDLARSRKQKVGQLSDIHRNPPRQSPREHLTASSVFVFENVAKFSRPFDESPLSSCSFLASCGRIDNAIDFSARHRGRFAFCTLAEPRSGSARAGFFIHES